MESRSATHTGWRGLPGSPVAGGATSTLERPASSGAAEDASPDAHGAETTTAPPRQHQDFGKLLAVGLMVSVGLHVALFELAPEFTPGDLSGTTRSMQAVDLPPRVEVPPAPEAIARPATPKVSAAADIAEDVTIAPTTFEANPSENLPPPPAASGAARSERPQFIPYDTPPRLENASEIQSLLQRLYPTALKNAGIEGTVVLWIYVGERGNVRETQVKESSGYPALDRAATRVAAQMQFVPARNRDRATAVWVAQRIRFEVL